MVRAGLRPLELAAAIRVAREQLGPCTPQLAKKRRGLIGGGWRPPGLAVAKLSALGQAWRQLVVGVLARSVGMLHVLLAVTGAIAPLPVGFESGFTVRPLAAEGARICVATVVARAIACVCAPAPTVAAWCGSAWPWRQMLSATPDRWEWSAPALSGAGLREAPM